MHILIESHESGTADIDLHIHANGTFTVRVGSAHAGSGRWDKNENKLRLVLPSGVFHRNDGTHGMAFEFEEK